MTFLAADLCGEAGKGVHHAHRGTEQDALGAQRIGSRRSMSVAGLDPSISAPLVTVGAEEPISFNTPILHAEQEACSVGRGTGATMA